MTAAAPRVRCYRCWRPEDLCLCPSLPTVHTATRVVVIQHPKERTHPFGTARLLRLCMPNAEVHTVYGGLDTNRAHPRDLPAAAAGLYPPAAAVDIAELPPAERPSTLVVLDGTWAHSKNLYRQNPWLQGLRRVRIAPAEPSRYRIRREPRPECLSTLEATVCALRVLEPATPGLDGLIAVFDAMVDRQIAQLASAGAHGRSKRQRQRESRRLSPHLSDPDLVVVYAESSLPGGDRSARRELVQLVAARLDGRGGTFEALVRPAGEPPAASHLAHMGLTLQQLIAGDDAATAGGRLRAFAGDGPITAWTQSSLEWAAPLLSPGAARFVLKTGYCNVQNRGAGFLDEVVVREALATVAADCHGRARVRLGNALAVARWLRTAEARPCA
ncbi:MAG: tRNA-uridine aminocarboxypropyltransferase [Planctomycetota bacterium]